LFVRPKNKLRILRWLFSASIFVLFVILMLVAFNMESSGAAPYVIFSLVCFIASILLLIPETVKPTCHYLSGLIVSFIFPDHKFSKPALTYTLACRYIELERYDDAIREYAKIIHYYPSEVEAYLGIISASSLAGETLLAEKYKKKLMARSGETIANGSDVENS
jgi:tetratricopeptide (TPR) repeat protein